MDAVKWLEVVLDTNREELDGLCARLTANGVTGMAIEDEADFKSFLEQNRPYWDYVDDALLEQQLKRLDEASREESEDIKDIVAEIVPTYKRECKV